MRLLPADRRLRWAALAGYAFAGLAGAVLLTIALFPIGLFKPAVERALTERFGRPVTIAALTREDRFSLTPRVVVADLTVPQPAWAGRGDLARIRRAELTLSTGPLLRGRIVPTAIRLVGARIALVRDRSGRENWHRGDQSDRRSRHTPVIRRLEIADSTLSYRDAKRDRQFALKLRAGAEGLAMDGRGTVRGSPVAVRIRGATVGRGGAWPFSAAIDGPELAISAKGTMASPLDTDRLAMDVAARATNLKLIDAVIEAGLFDTQPVRLSAHVERTRPDWRITRLRGTVGRSSFAGRLDVTRREGRTRVDGEVSSAALDPDDLSGPEGLARGAAIARAVGLKLVPNTRVDLSKIGRTDARLSFRIARLLSRGGESSLRSATGVATLDRQRLTVSPLRIALTQGAITGRMVVDQRGGAAKPSVSLDLRLTGSSIGAVAGGGGSITGRLDARGVLTGRGETIREAVGTAGGRIGLAARDGSLPERIAVALGFDAGRALFASGDDRAGLRCVIFSARLRGGRGRVSPLLVDTTQSRLEGAGTIAFPSEAVAVRLTGAPKRGAVLRLPGSAMLTGTIREPHVAVPREVRSVGNVFKAIGRAITGRQGPAAVDADCAGLAAGVLR